MTSITFLTSIPSRHARSRTSPLSRVRRLAADRRELTRGRRELDAVLAGHHGASMREELLSVMGRS